jgi:hypothetical protein
VGEKPCEGFAPTGPILPNLAQVQPSQQTPRASGRPSHPSDPPGHLCIVGLEASASGNATVDRGGRAAPGFHLKVRVRRTGSFARRPVSRLRLGRPTRTGHRGLGWNPSHAHNPAPSDRADRSKRSPVGRFPAVSRRKSPADLLHRRKESARRHRQDSRVPLDVRLLEEWNVPSTAIQIEGGSINTHENAILSFQMLAPHSIRKILLVTSAMHMPRAAGAFRKAGFEVIALSQAGTSLSMRNEICDLRR